MENFSAIMLAKTICAQSFFTKSHGFCYVQDLACAIVSWVTMHSFCNVRLWTNCKLIKNKHIYTGQIG